jgi:hypothetical protein
LRGEIATIYFTLGKFESAGLNLFLAKEMRRRPGRGTLAGKPIRMPNTLSLNVQKATAGKSGCHFNSVGGARVELQAIGACVEQGR